MRGGRLVAFGQYYRKAGRCHLARLIVDPGRRSRGIGGRFVSALMEAGSRDLGVAASSLFVLEDKCAAVCCYRKLGFELRTWPQGEPRLPAMLFMVRDAARGDG